MTLKGVGGSLTWRKVEEKARARDMGQSDMELKSSLAVCSSLGWDAVFLQHLRGRREGR